MPDQDHPSHDDAADFATHLERVGAFRSMVDNAFVGHVIADSAGIFRYVNRYFAQICGYRPEELIGQSISTVHTPEQLAVSRRMIGAATRLGARRRRSTSTFTATARSSRSWSDA